MNCPKCGAFNTDDARNCTTCGEPLTQGYEAPLEGPDPNEATYQNEPVYQAEPVYQQQPVDQYAPQYQPIEPAPAPNPKKNNSKKIVAIIIAAVVLVGVIVGGIFTFKYLSARVNVEDYIGNEEKAVSFTGYDGYGVLEYDIEDVIDYYEIYDELGGEPFDDFDAKEYENMSDKNRKKADKYIRAFKVKFDKESGLKNGDKVTLTITVDYDKINEDFEFENKLVGDETYTKEFTVSGLKAIEQIDPFEMVSSVTCDTTGYYGVDVAMTFSETEKTYGDFTAKIYGDYSYYEFELYDAASNKIASYSYNIDTDNYSGSGDITVTIDDSYYPVSDLNSMGINITATSKSFTPDTVSYLSKGDNLSEGDYNAFKSMADDDAKEYYQSPKFKKAYFGYDAADDENVLVFVYSYNYTEWDGTEVTYYGYVEYEDIKVNSSNVVLNADDIYAYHGTWYESVSEIEEAYTNYYPQFNSISVK
ncbi:MAG: zinc ribbon domain-containing protein [Eubacterium sp.]